MPRTIGDTAIEQVVAKTLHEKPRGAMHWSSRAMAKSSGLSQSAVVRIWRAFGIEPHRAETFKLSTDPLSSTVELENAIREYLAVNNRDPKCFIQLR